MKYASLVVLSLFGIAHPVTFAEELPTFVAQVVDDDVQIGYGVALEDVDGDGQRDILLADKRQFVWYRNPDWKRFVLAENLTEKDNVCMAARDINGDGRVEIAVGAGWNPSDTVNSGAVFYLQPPDDRTQMWTPIPLHHEPVVHRMRWVRFDGDKFVLVVAPLHGRGNQRNEGIGSRLLAYTMPEDPQQKWTTTMLDDTMHVTHNFEVGEWNSNERSEEIVYLGKEGAKLIHFDDGKWHSVPLEGVQGGGEVRLGQRRVSEPKSRFLATIEPFHGDRLVMYPREQSTTRGMELAGDLKQGHALAIADLIPGNPGPEIVCGWREKNAEGIFGVRLHYANEDGSDWQRIWIDQNGMACEDLRIADLDNDGRDDIVASGRSTHNLKIYWNREAEEGAAASEPAG